MMKVAEEVEKVLSCNGHCAGPEAFDTVVDAPATAATAAPQFYYNFEVMAVSNVVILCL